MSLVDLGKRLLDASKNGDTEKVRLLMTNGAPFTTDWLGTSPLHMAAQFGHVETSEVLLRAGISRDARTKVDRTPLHVAAQAGNMDIVNLLLEHGADANSKDMLRMTPLHWAVENEHVSVIKALLKNGADIMCINKFDKTPADIALDRGALHIRELLLDDTNYNSTVVDQTGHDEVSVVDTLTPEDMQTLREVTVHSNPVEVKIVRPKTSNSSNSPKPLFINPNVVSLASNLKHRNGSGATEQSSTSVLATLAALAEATAPISSADSNVSAAETLQWLQTHGLMMASDSPNSQISHAIEEGQHIALTEAGRMALKLSKEMTENSRQYGKSPNNLPKKYVTVVNPLEKFGTNNQSIVVSLSEKEDSVPVTKKLKLDPLSKENGQLSLDAVSALQEELERTRKQAELWKQQLEAKAKEASEYREKLSVLEKLSQSSQQMA